MCQREGIQNGKSTPCQTIVGKHIDKAVGDLIVELMSPVTLELSIAVQKELEQRWQESDQLWQQQLERARYEAELAKRRYLKVDPDNRLVSCTLEADWNEKLKNLNNLHDEHENYKAQKLSKITKLQQEKIMALSKDFATLWYAEGTPMQERKRMVRLLIDDVTLKKTEKWIDVHIRFRGGQIKSLQLPLPVNITKLRVTEPKVIELIDKLSDDYTDAKIADILNKQGYKPAVKKYFDLFLIQNLRWNYKIISHYDKLRKKGYLTSMELAKKLKISKGTVNQWARNKILKGYLANDRGEQLFELPSKKLWPIKRQGSPLNKRKKVYV